MCPRLLPDSFLPDVHARLVMYKRISGVTSEAELDDLQTEIVDRFGLLPEPAKNLLRIARLRDRRDARSAWSGSTSVPTSGSVVFGADTQVDPGSLILLVQRSGRTPAVRGIDPAAFHGRIPGARGTLHRRPGTAGAPRSVRAAHCAQDRLPGSAHASGAVMNDQRSRADEFRRLHVAGDPLVLFNAWDAGSARAVAAGGARAIATGSWSVAAAHGYTDGEVPAARSRDR